MKNITLILLSVLFSFVSLSQKENALIQQSLKNHQKEYNLTKNDINSWEIIDSHASKKEGISFYYVYQTFEDLVLYNAMTIIAIKEDQVIMTSNQFLPKLAGKVETKSATLSPQDAIHKIGRAHV